MTSSDLTQFNIKPSDLGRLQLGALLRQHVVFDDPALGTRIWEFEFEKATVRRTEWYGAQRFIDEAAEARNSSEGERWGDGRIVASVPMHIWAREIAPRMKDGNDGSVKRWLNSAENRAFRTFKGDV